MDAAVIVVGAGAAGLWAAARAAEEGASVLLVEKTARAGTKILLSGGTRCNLTTTLAPYAAARLFGPAGERFLRRAFRALPPAAVRERFAALGVPTVEACWEKVFPASDRARDVRDALLAWTAAAGGRLVTGTPVAGIAPREGGWTVRTAGGGAFAARALVLAPGGASWPRAGTTGDGWGWLAALDLPAAPPAPALVPLTSPAGWVRELSGIALAEVCVRLVDGAGRVHGERERPLLFTHTGVSGPGALDLSVHVARAPAPDGGWRLQLDLLPALAREEVRARLVAMAEAPGRRSLERGVRDALGASFPRRIVRAALAQAGLAGRAAGPAALARAERHRLVEALKGLAIPVDGTLGLERAEVTAGGLDLRAVDPGSMAVAGRPGLYVVGELLDLAGPIGGLNFQAAFATAELAARAAARATG
ncbi:MAG: aminoacetone oxidase family FAD-binding enzyme [Planctomycetota bacterium]